MNPITSTFSVTMLDTAPSADGLQNVVKAVHWQVVCTDGTFSAQQSGTDQLADPDPAKFVSFDALTEAEVLTWIPNHGADQTILDYLAADIARQSNPPIVTRPTPWS